MNNSKVSRILSIFLSLLLLLQQTGLAQVASSIDLSGKLAALRQSFTPEARFRPLHLRYLSYDSINNNFKLLVDKGTLANPKTSELESASKDLLKYFFIGLALPNDTFWVNLRPDSPDQVIDPLLEKTDIGRILLEADVELKKDTALATSPDTKEGKEYWDRLYRKAGELFGTTEVTIPTLTRPWIVPDEVIISESTDSAYIYKATLKVMLEEDYLKSSKNPLSGYSAYDFKDERARELNAYSTRLIKELILPKITQSINTSKKYANLRQVYYSLILASWFKSKFQANPGQYSNLIDSKDLSNLTTDIAYSKDTYFKQYQKSFQSGEYKFQIPTPTPQGQVIRSYFSGGVQPMPVMPPEGQSKAGIIRAPRQRPRIVSDRVFAMLAKEDGTGKVKLSRDNVETALGRKVTDEEYGAVEYAHEVEPDRGFKLDEDGRPVKHSDPNKAYTKEGIKEKRDRLAAQFKTPEERRKLMEAGLAGRADRADRDQLPLAQIIARINIEHGASSEGARQILVAINAASVEYDILSIRAAKDAVNILKIGMEHGLTHSEREVCAKIKAIIEDRIIEGNFKGIVGQIKYELEGRIEIVALGIQAQEGGDLSSPARNDAQAAAGPSKEAGPRADPQELIFGSLQGGMDAGIAASLVEASGCSFEEFQRISDGLMEMASSWKVMRADGVRSFPTGLEVFSFFMYLAQDENIDPRIRSLSQGNLRPLERILGQEWRNEITGLIETDRRASQDLPHQGDISAALDRLAIGAQTEEDVPFLTRILGINAFGKWGARGADHGSLALEASASQNPRLGMILQHLLRKALDSKDIEKANRIIDLMIVWSGRELEATQVFLALAAEQMHMPLPQLLDERLKAHGQYVSEEDAWIFGGFFERAEKLKKLYARLEGKYVAEGGLILEKDSLKSKALAALAGVIKNPRMRKTIADTIASAIVEARQVGMSVGFSMMEEIGGMIEGELTKDELRQKSGIIWDALSGVGFYDHEIGSMIDAWNSGPDEPGEHTVTPPVFGSSGENEPVNSAVGKALAKYNELGRTQDAAKEAAKIFVQAFSQMDEVYRIDSIQSIIDILEIAGNPDYKWALDILKDRARPGRDFVGIVADIRAAAQKDSLGSNAWMGYTDGRRLWQAWAPPEGSPWGLYCRKVLPLAGGNTQLRHDVAEIASEAGIRNLIRSGRTGPDTLVALDLGGQHSVAMAIELMRNGYQPVIVFSEDPVTIGNEELLKVLLYFAAEAEKLKKEGRFTKDSPPVFIFDAHRAMGKRLNIINLPEARKLKENGIIKAVYVTEADQDGEIRPDYQLNPGVNADMEAAIGGWKQEGIEVLYTGVGVDIKNTLVYEFDELSAAPSARFVVEEDSFKYASQAVPFVKQVITETSILTDAARNIFGDEVDFSKEIGLKYIFGKAKYMVKVTFTSIRGEERSVVIYFDREVVRSGMVATKNTVRHEAEVLEAVRKVGNVYAQEHVLQLGARMAEPFNGRYVYATEFVDGQAYGVARKALESACGVQGIGGFLPGAQGITDKSPPEDVRRVKQRLVALGLFDAASIEAMTAGELRDAAKRLLLELDTEAVKTYFALYHALNSTIAMDDVHQDNLILQKTGDGWVFKAVDYEAWKLHPGNAGDFLFQFRVFEEESDGSISGKMPVDYDLFRGWYWSRVIDKRGYFDAVVSAFPSQEEGRRFLSAAYAELSNYGADSVSQRAARALSRYLSADSSDGGLVYAPLLASPSAAKEVKEFKENPVVAQEFPADSGVSIVVSPNMFSASGAGRMFFDRVGGGIYRVRDDGQKVTASSDEFKSDSEELVEAYKRANPGRRVLAVLPNSNLGSNDWFVAVVDGKVYHYSADMLDGRRYDMLVVKRNGEIVPMTLSFVNQIGERGIFDESGRDISGEVAYGVYGQRIVKNGKVNVANLAGQFDDLRHLLRLPIFRQGKDEVILGVRDKVGEIYKDRGKVASALRGEPVELSLAPLRGLGISDAEILKTYTQWGYRSASGKTADSLGPGEFTIDNNSIVVVFLPGTHPHSFFGVTGSGRVLAGAVSGSTNFSGAGLDRLAEELIQKGAQDVFLWGNGKDVNVRLQDDQVVVQGAAPKASCAVIISVEAGVPASVPGGIDGSTQEETEAKPSLAINPQQRETGGIDFRSLPIVSRAMANLSAGAAGISMSQLRRVDLDKEWSDIEQLVSSGIAPSGERIKEYLQASSAKGELGDDIDKVLYCISEVYRLEEEKGSSTDEVLRDVLVVLEASRSPSELADVLVGAGVS